MELRIQRISRVRNVEEDAARSLIKKTDRQRANYYNFYADNDWGAAMIVVAILINTYLL